MKLRFSQALVVSQGMLPKLAGLKSDAAVEQVLNRGYRDLYEREVLRSFGLTDKKKREFTDEVLRSLVFQTEADAEAARLRGLVTGDAELWNAVRVYVGNLKSFKSVYYGSLGQLFKDDTEMMLDAVDVLCDRFARAPGARLRVAVRGLVDYQKVAHGEVMVAAYVAEMMGRYANEYTTRAVLRYAPGFPPSVGRHFLRLDFAPMAKMLVTLRRKLEEVCGSVDFTGVKKMPEAYARWIEAVEGLTREDIDRALGDAGGCVKG